MKFALCVLMFASMPVFAEVDCTFDVQNQKEAVKALSLRLPGGMLDKEERLITWSRPDGQQTTFRYGGCVDIGSVIVQIDPLRVPRTQEQVLAVARALAQRYWTEEVPGSKSAADKLVMSLDNSAFSIETSDDSTQYSVADEMFAGLYVLHQYSNGLDSITVAWQGNY